MMSALLESQDSCVIYLKDINLQTCEQEIRQFLENYKSKEIIINCATIAVSIDMLYKLNKIQQLCKTLNISCKFDAIDDKILNLLKIIDNKSTNKKQIEKEQVFITRTGLYTINVFSSFINVLKFAGIILYNIFKCILCKSKAKISDICEFLYQNSVEAFPIVALISFLVGLILAFVSVIQLERFGASIYVADLIAIAMTREMGCIMLGVIMSGRTGAAFAASLGSMQANEELDAFKTFGIDKIDFLVTPRVLSLAIMMPVLCVFADIIGIVGGMVSAIPFAKSGVVQYLLQTKNALSIIDILIGLVKSIVFGIIIGTIGCYKGINCGRNASAVGIATTSTVVQSITYIIIADAIFAVIINFLNL